MERGRRGGGLTEISTARCSRQALEKNRWNEVGVELHQLSIRGNPILDYSWGVSGAITFTDIANLPHHRPFLRLEAIPSLLATVVCARSVGLPFDSQVSEQVVDGLQRTQDLFQTTGKINVGFVPSATPV